jgi:hypothetical protein
LSGYPYSKKPERVCYTPATTDTLSVTIVTFTDTPDSKTYKTAKMPDGRTWIAENLNYTPKSVR